MSALEDLLDELDATRERTLLALEMLPDAALIQPGVVGRWSVAELLSILTAWDAEVVTGLMQLQGGKTPERLLAALRQPDAYNAQRYHDAQGRGLDAVFEDFQRSRMHLEAWLSDLTERALTDRSHFRPLGGASLGQIIADATYRHEARYLPFLRSLAEGWEGSTATHGTTDDASLTAPGHFIDLGNVDILDLASSNGDAADVIFPEDDDDDFD